MKRMSTAYESTGRTRQKMRTRKALVAAARELLVEDVNPTVELAADRAGISRTTAYRYFRNRRQLLVATYPETERTSLLDEGAPAEALERFEVAIERFGQQLLDHEPELRAQLRLSLDGGTPEDLPLRHGRAVTWFEEALAPAREELGSRGLRRLAVTVRAAFGIEPLVWLTDVAKLSTPEAVETMKTTARLLVRASLEP